MPVIIMSGVQVTEELWKLCFHCNCVETTFRLFTLFCFILEMGQTFQMNGAACMCKTWC